VYHRSGRMLHKQSLYKIDSIAGRGFFLTQFIRSQDLFFDDAILCILLLKNFLLAEQTFDLNSFQYSD